MLLLIMSVQDKKVIQNAHAGDVITFDYRIACEEWDNEGGMGVDGTGYGPYFYIIDPNQLLCGISGKEL